mgnify:FL=1
MSDVLFPVDKIWLGLCAIASNLESKLWGEDLSKIGDRFAGGSLEEFGGPSHWKENYLIKKVAMFALLYLTTRSVMVALLLTLAVVAISLAIGD